MSGDAFVDAVLGTAGWERETIDVDGRPQPVSVRRHANARATLRVAPLDARRLTLFVDGRRPLLVDAASVDAADCDPIESVLRLVVEWQDRLGEPAADAAFWRALIGLGVRGLVLDAERVEARLDWSRLDAAGQPQEGYLLSCGCQQLSGGPRDVDPGRLRIAANVPHEGWSETFCECRQCGRRYRVDEDTSYHFTTYSWSDVSCDGRLARYFE